MVLLPSPATGSLLRPFPAARGLDHTNMATFEPPPVPTRVCPVVGPAWGRPAPERSVCLTAAAGGPAAVLLGHFPGGKRHGFSPGLAVLTLRGAHPASAGLPALVPRCCGGGACGRAGVAGARGPRLALWPKPCGAGVWRCPWGPRTAPEHVALSRGGQCWCRGDPGERLPAVGCPRLPRGASRTLVSDLGRGHP